MKKLITILLLAISGFASAQTYQLNYPDIRIGNSNTGKIVLRGSNVQFPFLALGSTTDSVLTIVGGVIKKVPRSQFSGGGSSYTSSNGITLTGSNFALGGNMTANTNLIYPNGTLFSLSNSDIYSVTQGGIISTNAGGISLQTLASSGGSAKVSINMVSPFYESSIGSPQNIYFENNVNGRLAEYAAKYRSGMNNRSIVDKEYVDSVAAASGGGSTPDTTIYRTVSNSFSKAQTNTQISNAIAVYSPPSQVDNDLTASTTRAPSKSAVNTALALKENTANKQNSLTVDGTGLKFPTVDAVNAGLATKGNGTVTSFSKTDGTGIISSVSNPTTTPNHTIAVDTTTIRTVANSYTLSGLQTKFNAYLTTANATATYVPLTRTVSTGNGLSGGGVLSSNLTITADTAILATKANTRNLAQLQTTFNTKQATLVSGTNIKTINGSSVLGIGDLVVGGAVSSLTTTGSSGAATLTSGVLNIPTYVATDFYPLETEFEGQGISSDKFRLKAAGVTVAKGGTGVGTLTGLVKGNGTSAFSAAVAGTDYLTPTGSAAGLTSFPTLNQNTTGSAASLTTARNIWNVSFNGTANVTGKPVFTAGATGAASINIPHGVAPTSPVNGDFWTTSTGFFARINGVTYSFLPLSGGTLTGGLFGTTSEFSTYARVGASASTHIDVTSGDVKYYASNGTTLLSVYPLTLTTSRVQRYQDDDGTIALTKNYATGQTIGANTTGNSATTTLAANSTQWLGLMYNNTTPTTAPIYVMGSADGGTYGYTPISNLSTSLGLASGTYTPTGTITDGSGTVTSITPLTTHYSRVGNQVTVSGAVTFSTAASNTNVTIELTLPIASNFGNGYDAFGSGDVASSLTNYSAHVIVTGNPTTDKAIITLNTLNGTFTAYYRYMYTII